MEKKVFLRNIYSDIKIKLLEEFDRNFERKAFFTKTWDARKRETKGTLMLQTGTLRRSIHARIDTNAITFYSHVPYAKIHNEGGVINVGARSQVLHFNKKGRFNKNNKRAYYAQKASIGAHAIKMPQRQFIGDSPEVRKFVKEIIIINCHKEFNAMAQDIAKHLK